MPALRILAACVALACFYGIVHDQVTVRVSIEYFTLAHPPLGLGENPTVLEELLVRRVTNGWVTVHALELELTLRVPSDARDRAHLDAALTRAQKRYTEAIRELARVRKLQAPAIRAQLNVAATQTVVNG